MRKTEGERFLALFDRLESIERSSPWPNGLFNMLEWLTWNTNGLLGLSKTEYWKKAVKWAFEEDLEKLAQNHSLSSNDYLQQRLDYVERKITEEQKAAEMSGRYDKQTNHLSSPLEALRRAKYHSEDFLNKEFDVFWSLVSDHYLDTFYLQFYKFDAGGEWASHGNGGIFYRSFNLDPNKAQLDSVSYNKKENIFIGNELKLRSKKGDEQLLKYVWIFSQLIEKKEIPSETTLNILIIGEKYSEIDLLRLVDCEIEKSKVKTGWRKLLSEDAAIISKLKETKISSVEWRDILNFNQNYLLKLDPKKNQVEYKLIDGFNRTLQLKSIFNTHQT